MDIVVANGFVMERCTFFSREYCCCVLHNTRCKCEDYNPRNSKPLIYRGDVYNALEAERIKSLDGILTDPYKDGYHDGLKKAIQILENIHVISLDNPNVPIVIPPEVDA